MDAHCTHTADRIARRALTGLALLLIGAAAATLSADEDGVTYDGTQTWAFAYPNDALRAGAALDLRYLNEPIAGQSGFVTATADGSFLDGAGKPLRFWCINAKFNDISEADLQREARFLAKIGVNLARFHTDIAPKGKDSAIEDADKKEIDAIWKAESIFKKEGIYVAISPYWRSSGGKNWGIEGYNGDAELWGVQFFNPTLQAAYKTWVTKLYDPKNPYTGIRLADDPAVAVILSQNEDGLFFWTFQGIKGPQKELLGKQFGSWLTTTYGSLDKAKEAWGGQANPGDDFANGKVGILSTWELNNQPVGKKGRGADQLAFMAKVQRDHYQDIHDHYRKIGCKQLINGANWVTSDSVRLNDLERWTNTPDEVMAVNRYFTGKHDGDNNGWRIDPGHVIADETALKNVRAMPTNIKQVQGKPFMITESTWVQPNQYQSEGPFLMAAYQSLTGVDCFFWFAQTSPEYDEKFSMPWLNIQGQHPMFKWSCSIPAIEGAFPASALAFRLGYIKQGKPVVIEQRTLESMEEREYPLIGEDATFDPNRQEGGEAQRNASKRQDVAKGVDPLAFLVGPVEVVYGGDPAKTKVEDLKPFIHADKKTIASNTGEILMDYGVGVCTINAPKIKGACGFLKDAGGTETLDGVTITSGNRYATIMVVAMDDKPLPQSKKVLVQVGTISRPTGWSVERKGDKEIIAKVGTTPWQVVKTDATIQIRTSVLTKATLLDVAGFPAHEVPCTSAGGVLTVKLPDNAMYVIVE